MIPRYTRPEVAEIWSQDTKSVSSPSEIQQHSRAAKLRDAIILLGLALTPQAAKSGDADELKVLGFSPDGRYFAFEQRGTSEDTTYSIRE